VHPHEAVRLNITDGNWVKVQLDGFTAEVILQVNEQVPPGVALIPRSMGVPINAPALIELEGAESGKK
jgi:anaerobic selenocysteine-containing dehydrogenase